MSVLWLMPTWSAPSELWMQRMLCAVEDGLAAIACYEPKAALWNKRVPVINLGRRADPLSIERGRGLLREWLASSVVTHIFAHYPPFVLRYAHLLRDCGKPLFVHCHGYDITWDLRRPDAPDQLFYPPDYPEQVRELSTRAMMIANSRATAAKLTEIGVNPSRIIVKYLGVPVLPSAGPPLDRSLPLRLLFLGRLVDFKGPDLLIRAFTLACSRGLTATLTLAGDGPLRQACETLRAESPFHDRIEIPGPVSPETGEQLRARSHIFTTHNQFGPVTHQEEAFGVAVAEAMASALPIVSTRSGSIPELVTHERTGLLVTPGDIDSHAEAILQLANDAGLRHRLGSAAREEARARFSDEIERAILRKLLDLNRD